MYDRPVNSSQAKFSLEYSMAIGLLHGRAGLEEYSDDAVINPEIQALLHITRKEYVEKLESEFPTEVHITLKDGSTVSTSVDMPVGSTAAPLTPAQLIQKFDDCAKGHMPVEKISLIKDRLLNLGNTQSIKSLMMALRSSESTKTRP